MAVSKELRELVELLGTHDERYQVEAVRMLLPLLNRAEQDVADSHLTRAERRAIGEERRLQNYERRFGKAFADELRAKMAALRRGEPWE